MKTKVLKMDPKTLIAHRGDNTYHPENTLMAIESALTAGALAFEFDVQMNADHSLVAFHDADFLRMNGDSKAKIVEVSDVKMSQLSVHEPSQFEKLHYPTAVTYFDEVIELMKRYPKVRAYVEIKDESLDFWGIELVMNKLLKSLVGLEEQAIVISFNEPALVYTKLHSQLKIGLVFEDFSERMKAIATKLKPEYLVSWYKVLPDEQLWQGDWKWMIYTVNDVALAKSLLERGDIDFVETDDIKLLLNG